MQHCGRNSETEDGKRIVLMIQSLWLYPDSYCCVGGNPPNMRGIFHTEENKAPVWGQHLGGGEDLTEEVQNTLLCKTDLADLRESVNFLEEIFKEKKNQTVPCEEWVWVNCCHNIKSKQINFILYTSCYTECKRTKHVKLCDGLISKLNCQSNAKDKLSFEIVLTSYDLYILAYFQSFQCAMVVWIIYCTHPTDNATVIVKWCCCAH